MARADGTAIPIAIRRHLRSFGLTINDRVFAGVLACRLLEIPW